MDYVYRNLQKHQLKGGWKTAKTGNWAVEIARETNMYTGWWYTYPSEKY